MKIKPFLIGLLLVLATALPASAAGKIRVITSIPDLAEFTREIGGDLVDVESLATGVEDPHGVPMKPSFVPKLSHADLVVIVGLELEHAFMPALIEASRNPKIQPGKPGSIDCSLHIAPLEVPKSISRTEGEIHPNGNPHYTLDPVLAKTAIRAIYDGLVLNFPEHTAAFKAGRDAYLAKLDKKIAEWRELAKPLQGVKFVSYHNEWVYFNHRYGLVYLGTIELRHGIEPTARHVTETIARMKAEHCKIVVREPQFSDRVPNQIAAVAGAKVIKLPIMVGGVPQAKTYIDLIDYNLRTLLEAAKETSVAAQ
ncbi:MAG TPA: metal ABC transporter substrate-binding protein [Candidatus Sulfotelmatobacter sp.]|nr:metal ABC transporter substrate-binding protein [Candidatus Sulfotelmatobacter sp.]HWI56972.1 metal ABC transporter substrate-binding protein [Bacillota bacterium]